jgi:hypothetical protein
MADPDVEQLALTRWTIQQRVFLFYGNGGRFAGEGFERWHRELEAARDLRLYVGGGGDDFTFNAGERARGTALFKRKGLRFEIVTENPRHRLLGSTARLVGVDLHLHSWEDCRRAFAKLHDTTAVIDQLQQTLLLLRAQVDQEVALRQA